MVSSDRHPPPGEVLSIHNGMARVDYGCCRLWEPVWTLATALQTHQEGIER